MKWQHNHKQGDQWRQRTHPMDCPNDVVPGPCVARKQQGWPCSRAEWMQPQQGRQALMPPLLPRQSHLWVTKSWQVLIWGKSLQHSLHQRTQSSVPAGALGWAPWGAKSSASPCPAQSASCCCARAPTGHRYALLLVSIFIHRCMCAGVLSVSIGV